MGRLLPALLIACPCWAGEDPLIVSPEAYSRLHENDRVRVLALSLAPGASDAFHGHPDGVYYVEHGGNVRLHGPDGSTREVVLRTGTAGFQRAIDGHRVENTGPSDLRVIMVELKNPLEVKVDGGLLESAREEIVALHRFFEDWFRGRLTDDEASFARLERALAADFVFVSPEGRLVNRETLIDGVRRAHGKWRSDETARIWIEDVRLHRADGSTAMLTYQEWQVEAHRRRGRLSTVLLGFGDDDTQPRWLHVHEVWIPDE